jgi:F0F1-type ATP synthase assembly protein I
MPSNDEGAWALAGRYSGMALMVPLSTLAGYIIGRLLDKLFHTHFLAIVFLILGTVAGFVEILRKLQADTKADGS